MPSRGRGVGTEQSLNNVQAHIDPGSDPDRAEGRLLKRSQRPARTWKQSSTDPECFCEDAIRKPKGENPDMLSEIRAEFRRYRKLAEDALADLDDESFFHRPGDAVNPIALIVKHLAGNLRSRWTDFLTTDGEKPDRRRDTEFELVPGETREALMQRWSVGWSALENTLGTLSNLDLDRTITIRGEAMALGKRACIGHSHRVSRRANLVSRPPPASESEVAHGSAGTK